MIQENNEHQSLLYERRVYTEQLRLIQKEIDRISLTNLDLINAQKTAEALTVEEGFVPIGGGAYINVNINSTKILVPIGGGYISEMDAEKATAELKRRIDATKNAVEKLSEEYRKIADRLNEISQKLRQSQENLQTEKRVDENIREDYV